MPDWSYLRLSRMPLCLNGQRTPSCMSKSSIISTKACGLDAISPVVLSHPSSLDLTSTSGRGLMPRTVLVMSPPVALWPVPQRQQLTLLGSTAIDAWLPVLFCAVGQTRFALRDSGVHITSIDVIGTACPSRVIMKAIDERNGRAKLDRKQAIFHHQLHLSDRVQRGGGVNIL
nr:hypothetical protein CFP56_37103 [Quercus suber]